MLGLVLVLLVMGSGCDSAGSPPGPEARRLVPLEWATLAVNDFQPTLHRNGWVGGADLNGHSVWFPNDPSSDTTYSVIYSSGLWLAARQQGEIRANLVWVGPDGFSNYRVQQPDSLPRGVFYVTPDSLAGEVTNWPAGAPTDAQGRPTLYGDAMAWVGLTSDTTGEGATSGPIAGLEVRQAVYGYVREDLRDVIFVRYAITNRGADLTDAYLGFHSDTDLTISRFHCNATGYTQEQALTYTYMNTGTSSCQDVPERLRGLATGFTLLETPGEIGVTSHRILWKNTPVDFGETGIERPEQVLWALQGLSSEGEPMVNPVTGEATKFAFTGDPVTGEGWLGPSLDVRSLLGSGPFTLASGETVTVTVVWVVTRGSTLAEGLEQLKAKVEQVRDEPKLWRF